MRSRQRDKQNIWFSKISENHDDIDTVITYEKPIMKKMTVSSTSGTAEEISAGIVPNYDRYITSYDRSFCDYAEEGVVCWVDSDPEFNQDGALRMEDDEITPVTMPDYKILKIIDTKKGNIARYGISKIKGVYQ